VEVLSQRAGVSASHFEEMQRELASLRIANASANTEIARFCALVSNLENDKKLLEKELARMLADLKSTTESMRVRECEVTAARVEIEELKCQLLVCVGVLVVLVCLFV